MRPFAILMSVATILALNIVIGLGLLGSGVVVSSDHALLFGRALTALHVVLPISSVLMFALLLKDRHWISAVMFAVIVGGMLVVLMLRVIEQKLSLGVHLAGDLCALNIYLIVVPWYWSHLRRGDVRVH